MPCFLSEDLHCVTNTVSVFLDFESLIRELFKPQLEELAVTQPGSRFTSDDLSSLLESPTNQRVGAHCNMAAG